MSNKIPRGSLKPGDVLLYQGTGVISELIRLFDGGSYSHASVYDGANMLEALADGTVTDSVDQSVKTARFVDVYRFVSADGTHFGQPGCDSKPVLDRIKFYEQNPERYAYEQILLLALLCSTRHPKPGTISPALAMILRKILDSAADVIARMIHAGKEPMICSELVYRCYTEAGEQYQILIRGTDIPLLASFVPMTAADAPPTSVDVAFQQEAAAFLSNYSVAKRHKPGGSPIAVAMAAGGVAKAAAVADFVTPHDLENSPDLQKFGTLE